MATIKDVAKEAGVAVETVSRVLNNRGYISEKTRNKVFNAMKALNYTPNAVAQGLSKKKLDTIAIIVPHIVHPYFAKVISQLEKEATKRNYKVIIYNSSGDERRESRVIQICQSNFISGVILFSTDISKETLDSFHIPIILIERNPVGNTYSILCDNEEGGRLAAEHLISHGCRHMVAIGTINVEDMPGDTRESSFQAVCAREKCSCSIYRSTPEEYASMEYYSTIEAALDENPDCDGVFCTSDLIAAQVIQVCNRRGKQIPKDIKLVGFDDVNLSRLTCPSITTIRQPIREIVAQAIDTITAVNEHKEVKKIITFPVTLVPRAST
ncbi:MAG: LacI family DNA-binding transcriptional regulator [Lachnospiraceae bacterium]|nr:LacI family DNA-binding transcriptional regulator [Lachnospiraceae bacterium]